MFDENNVPVGQRYDFFMHCCQRLLYGKSACRHLWVERKPQGAAIDGVGKGGAGLRDDRQDHGAGLLDGSEPRSDAAKLGEGR